VLFLSRIHPKKGLDLLIPAFRELLRSWPADAQKPKLALVGPDADGYRSEVETMVREQGITEQVLWTGMLQGSEKVQAYVDSDLFVLPSYQENFGIAVAEAMAAGLPVIISDRLKPRGHCGKARGMVAQSVAETPG
jgi:glycosyltransferase involved in cell wall biosynthesis